MSMSPTHERDFRHQQDVVDGEPRERTASPLLWALLILALIAAPAWWWIRNSSEPTPATPLTPSTQSSEVMPAPAQTTPSAMVPKREPRTTAAARTHDARPLASNAAPAYPPRALRAGVEGGVVARIDVDPSGRVSDVSIVERSGTRDRDLDRAVVDAVRDWRFEPAMRDGRAVASTVQLPVDFKAQQ